MSRTVYRACPLCEACCGLRLTVDGDEITDVRGDPDDPLSRGHVCPKGVALPELNADPDRLRAPMRRVGDAWEELGWDEALDLAVAGLKGVQAEHGRDAVAAYLGNPTIHNLGAMLFAPDVVRALRTKSRYSATSVDQLPHMLVAHWMFGHQLLMPVPDVDRTSFLLVLGANPIASGGSMMTAPGFGKRMKALRERGGRIVLLDPRRTETARHVDAHHFIRPGTDALLLAAMVEVLFDEGLVSMGRLEGLTDGVAAVRDAVRTWTPERVAPATGVPAAVIRGLARDLAAAEAGVVYARMGASVQAFGTTTQWLAHLLNLLTGNLDRPGGAMFTSPAVDPLGRIQLIGRGGYARWTSRVRGLPEVGGELPVAALAEEITTPGPGQVRGLLTFAGNPVLSTPDGVALDQALSQLDFYVAIDPYLNETTRHAHLILPPLPPLQREHYDAVFNVLSVRNTAKWSPRVFEPEPGRLDDWQILAGLQERLVDGRRARLAVRAKAALGPRGLIALGLRAGPHGRLLGGLTLEKVEASVHGVDLGPLEPVLPGRLRTTERRIQAAPPPVLEDLKRLPELLHGDRPPDLDLQLIGRRHVRSNNSWMHNVPSLVTGRDRCTLLLHPNDAAARGLADGDLARVRSRVGQVEVPVEVTDTVMPGVVSLPHGYGHGRQGTRLRVAAAHAGVSITDLPDARVVDPVGGTAVLTGVPVAVEAAG